MSNDDGISSLTENDVLLGRGRGYSEYIGNERFRKLADTFKKEYNSVDSNLMKVVIARELYLAVKEKGGRFLKLVQKKKKIQQSVWQVADFKTAEEKCKQTLREKAGPSRSKQARKEQRDTNNDIKPKSSIQESDLGVVENTKKKKKTSSTAVSLATNNKTKKTSSTVSMLTTTAPPALNTAILPTMMSLHPTTPRLLLPNIPFYNPNFCSLAFATDQMSRAIMQQRASLELAFLQQQLQQKQLQQEAYQAYQSYQLDIDKTEAAVALCVLHQCS